jgi:hypothetical protein
VRSQARELRLGNYITRILSVEGADENEQSAYLVSNKGNDGNERIWQVCLNDNTRSTQRLPFRFVPA